MWNYSRRKLPQLQHIKNWAHNNRYWWRNRQICIKLWRHFRKKWNLEFRRHFDDVTTFMEGKWHMKTYLQLILNMFMKKKLGVHGLFKELQWFLYGHVFAHIWPMEKECARARGKLCRAVISLIMVVESCARYQINGNFMFY